VPAQIARPRREAGSVRPRRKAPGLTCKPEVGLAPLDELGDQLEHYHLMHDTRRAMLERVGRRKEAQQAYARAADLPTIQPQVSFLLETDGWPGLRRHAGLDLPAAVVPRSAALSAAGR